MKKFVSITISLLIIIFTLSSCSSGNINTNDCTTDETTYVFTDSCGREVRIPKNITKIAPSGSTAQMVLFPIAYDLLVGLSSTPSTDQMKYFPESMLKLPTLGQFYGSKANLNMESLISCDPDIIIDLGDKKDNHKEDMDLIQKQTGIPTIFIEATLNTYSQAYKTLGKILNRNEKGDELSNYIDNVISNTNEKSKLINDNDKISVMYGTGTTGLAVNAEGSIQSDSIELIGAVNAIKTDEISNKNGGTIIDMEQLYVSNPDIIIFDSAGAFDMVINDNQWNVLPAIQNKKYYEIPCSPYNWMSSPPSINKILGLQWLANLIYPNIYDYNMIEVAKEYYSLFWHYELSDAEATQLLSKSTLLE